MYDEQFLIKQLQQGDERAFTLLFRKFYKNLVLFAGNFLPEKEVCEDIVQSVFVNIWDKRKEMDITTSFRSFLLKSVKNSCLDELRHRKVVVEHENSYGILGVDADLSTEQYVLYSELVTHLNDALNQLSDKQREVFEMSRLQGVKYKKIAQKLNISERAVEDRMAKTMKILRKYLKDFLSFLILLHFL